MRWGKRRSRSALLEVPGPGDQPACGETRACVCVSMSRWWQAGVHACTSWRRGEGHSHPAATKGPSPCPGWCLGSGCHCSLARMHALAIDLSSPASTNKLHSASKQAMDAMHNAHVPGPMHASWQLPRGQWHASCCLLILRQVGLGLLQGAIDWWEGSTDTGVGGGQGFRDALVLPSTACGTPDWLTPTHGAAAAAQGQARQASEGDALITNQQKARSSCVLVGSCTLSKTGRAPDDSLCAAASCLHRPTAWDYCGRRHCAGGGGIKSNILTR